MQIALKKYFGYDKFRPLQEKIINNVLKNNDSFVLMPTGGGKSLCFQLPALKMPGLTLVISPLIALMKDQVDTLQANGIKAEFINSSLSQAQIDNIVENIKNNQTKILYIAPERLAIANFKIFLQSLNISLIAIDEVHCISEWGHDFRPDYRNLSSLKKEFPSTPLIALTATATPKVKNDIIHLLNLKKAKVFTSSFDRKNLYLDVINKKNAFPKLVNLLEKYRNESVIIYCHSRKETEKIASNLKLNGFSARAYHAGLEVNKRKSVQDSFVKDRTNIIVATIAFGMGIDKPDVRLIVHYTFPKTLEGYYQEIGRAGRDGLDSKCVIFYTYADVRKHEFFINRIDDNHLAEISRNKLSDMLNFCELSTCRKKYLLKYFAEEMKTDNCQACDICLTKREKFDATMVVQKILSTIIRTNSRFGKNYIIDVILGKNTQKIKINQHEQLSVFGIVDDLGNDELSQIIKQLIDLDCIQKSEGQYPTLSLSKKGIQFLKNKETLELNKPTTDIVSRPKSQKASLNYNQDLFQILRNLRKDLAEQANVPPFVIFGDKSLMEMAYYFPKTKDDFARITGVGTKKLAEFNEAFLGLIHNFLKNNNVSPAEFSTQINTSTTKQIRIRKPQYHQKTKELINKKIPIERIAKNQGKKIDTIVNHIEKLTDAGEKLDLEYLKLPKDRYAEISEAFFEIGDEKLKPVYEYLNGKFAYDELKLVRVLLRS